LDRDQYGTQGLGTSGFGQQRGACATSIVDGVTGCKAAGGARSPARQASRGHAASEKFAHGVVRRPVTPLKNIQARAQAQRRPCAGQQNVRGITFLLTATKDTLQGADPG